MGAAAAVTGHGEGAGALDGPDNDKDVGALARARGRGGASAAEDGGDSGAVAGRITAVLFLGLAGEGRRAGTHEGNLGANGAAVAVQKEWVCTASLAHEHFR